MTQRILYFIVPGISISPFDVTLAADAGFDQVIPLPNVSSKSVSALVQDAIFCRPPGSFNDTGVFIGGRDVHLATDMFKQACKAMVGPFQIGLMADPNGAYSTSASAVALLAQAMQDDGLDGLNGRSMTVMGAGPVGLCCAVLAARLGAKVRLCALTADDSEDTATRFWQRYETDLEWVSAETMKGKAFAVGGAEVLICAAKAGVRVLGDEVMCGGNDLRFVLDTNAVPPSGIEGVNANDKAEPLQAGGANYRSFGPLTLGNLKYKTEFAMFRQLQTSAEPARLDFLAAYDVALEELRLARERKAKAA